MSTLLSDNIIAINHYFLFEPYWIDWTISHSLLILLQYNGEISPSPWIIIFCHFSLFTPHGWVQLLVGITDYTISDLLSDHVIAIYHYFKHVPYLIDCAVSHYLAILFQHNVAISLSPRFIVYLFLFISSSKMGATICWDHWLHWQYFTKQYYYIYIPLFRIWPLLPQF